MKGAIIVNAYKIYPSVQHQVDRLKEEFLIRNVRVDVLSNKDVLVYLTNSKIASKLKKYDFIINLDKDKYVALMIEKLGIPLFNNAESLILCDDKMLTHITLTNHLIKMPKTISAPLCYSKETNNEWLTNVTEILSFPLVAKECYGSLGEQVYLISSLNELIDFEENHRYKPHIYQEYIESSKGRDVRLILVGGKVIAYMERYSDTDFRSNLSKGGKARNIHLTKAFKNAAETAAKILKLDYCGIDLLYGPNNEPILCEVNSNAFFKGIEEVTEINVAARLVEHIIRKVSY